VSVKRQGNQGRLQGIIEELHARKQSEQVKDNSSSCSYLSLSVGGRDGGRPKEFTPKVLKKSGSAFSRSIFSPNFVGPVDPIPKV